MKKEQLFNEFEPFSTEDWKANIEKDLKGKSYDSLFHTSAIGTATEPVFTKENSSNINPFARGSKKDNNTWVISESIELSSDSKKDNEQILSLLNKGLTGVNLYGNPTAATFQGIAPEYITTEFSDYANITELISTIKKAFGDNKNSHNIYLNYDPICTAAFSGEFDENSVNASVTNELLSSIKNYTRSRLFTVNANAYHNCGAVAVSELGLAIAQAHEYLVVLLNTGLTIDEASAQIKINLSSGRDFFTEVSKIRACRMLWSRVIEAYKPEHSCSKSIIIKSITSKFGNTVYDPYNNMLRATTQAMAAAIGGADIIEVTHYDAVWSNGTSFSKRVARNVQLLLQDESYLDKVADPAGGSYYIESFTNELAEKAWTKFQKIEKKGGFTGLVTSGNLARELREEAQEQIDKFNSGELKVLGVNLYPDNKKTMIDLLSEAGFTIENQNTNFEPIQEIRLTGIAEQERATKELEETK